MTERRGSRTAGAADHATGFAKPPLHANFRKGQSGNPAARPPKVCQGVRAQMVAGGIF